jgi:hypothetical protein
VNIALEKHDGIEEFGLEELPPPAAHIPCVPP